MKIFALAATLNKVNQLGQNVEKTCCGYRSAVSEEEALGKWYKDTLRINYPDYNVQDMIGCEIDAKHVEAIYAKNFANGKDIVPEVKPEA